MLREFYISVKELYFTHLTTASGRVTCRQNFGFMEHFLKKPNVLIVIQPTASKHRMQKEETKNKQHNPAHSPTVTYCDRYRIYDRHGEHVLPSPAVHTKTHNYDAMQRCSQLMLFYI